MSLSHDLAQFHRIFIDTAIAIYHLEAHPRFGPPAKEVVNTFQSGTALGYTSVVTLTEVLPKPVALGDTELVDRFLDFAEHGPNLTLLDITAREAELAGRLRGRYPGLKTADALQVAAAMLVSADVFVTNDANLKKIREIRVLLLTDYA